MATQFYPKAQAELEFLAMTGDMLKERGMRKAAKNHRDDLVKAQYLAYVLAERGAHITIEDVRTEWAKRGLEWTLGNASGSVFRDIGRIKWQLIGYRPAKRPEAHARVIRLWKLKT
jgi:hypothetical protein